MGVIGLVLIVAVGMGIIAWNSKPQLIDVYPQSGAVNAPATTSIRLVFSHAMNRETVNARLKIEPVIEGTFSWEANILTFTPSKPWPGGKEINLILEAGARASSWLSFPMDGQSWSFTTSKAALAYLWPSYGNADIYSLDPETGEIRQFTHGMGVLDYSTSSDGMVFYFAAGNSQGGTDLYRLDAAKLEDSADSSYQPETLLVCGSAQCRSPAVSYDERYLAYEYIVPTLSGDSSPAQIWMLNLTSLETLSIGQASHETVQPSWSPTGLLAYYDRTNSGYQVINPATQERVQLANQTGQPGAWSTSGEFYLASEIAYIRAAGGTERGISHLIRYDVQNQTTEDMSGENEVEDVEASYSLDGKSIIFARKFLDAEHWTFGRQVWIMNADGSNPHPITDEADYNHYDLAWSRDGSQFAYVRFNQAKLSDPPELWMVNTDGSNAVQLVIGGYSPTWIP